MPMNGTFCNVPNTIGLPASSSPSKIKSHSHFASTCWSNHIFRHHPPELRITSQQSIAFSMCSLMDFYCFCTQDDPNVLVLQRVEAFVCWKHRSRLLSTVGLHRPVHLLLIIHQYVTADKWLTFGAPKGRQCNMTHIDSLIFL